MHLQMACSWSPNSKSIVTSAADRTVKLCTSATRLTSIMFTDMTCCSGDVETKKAQVTWTVGSGVDSQQVGNTWTAGDDIVSLSMSGDLNIFDKRVGDKPSRVIYVRCLLLSGPTVDSLTRETVGPTEGCHCSTQDSLVSIDVYRRHC